jgi:hypothetical protein
MTRDTSDIETATRHVVEAREHLRYSRAFAEDFQSVQVCAALAALVKPEHKP